MFLLALLVLAFNLCATEPIKCFHSDTTGIALDLLKMKNGLNKTCPSDVELAFFTALMYYPDFKETKINVRRRNIKTTMQCRPTTLSVFRKKENRRYKILIDNEKVENNGIVFEELPFNAQVGVFGHELAHIVDFEKKNNLQVIRFGMDYLNHEKRRQIEQEIDLIAIDHGLGYQLNAFAMYVFEESNTSEKYREYKRRFYFQPFEIRNILSALPFYQFKTMVAEE